MKKILLLVNFILLICIFIMQREIEYAHEKLIGIQFQITSFETEYHLEKMETDIKIYLLKND